jgi:hypothetical protein
MRLHWNTKLLERFDTAANYGQIAVTTHDNRYFFQNLNLPATTANCGAYCTSLYISIFKEKKGTSLEVSFDCSYAMNSVINILRQVLLQKLRHDKDKLASLRFNNKPNTSAE